MSKEKRFLNILGKVDEKYIEEAAPYAKETKKNSWHKWTSIAACFALIAILGVGTLWGGWFSGNDTVTLDNGATINFVKCDAVGGSLALDYDVTSRELNAKEVYTLFGDLPVIANAIFTVPDNKLVGFDGKIGDVKMVISTSDLPILDTTIVGSKENTEVNGVSVTAGYFLTDPNSRGEQTAIYFATFELGSSKVYVESAGAKAKSETVKNDLAVVIEKLTANGVFDITQLK